MSLSQSLGRYTLPVLVEITIQTYEEIPYSQKFSRVKYFAVLPNSTQKQIFADKIFMV